MKTYNHVEDIIKEVDNKDTTFSKIINVIRRIIYIINDIPYKLRQRFIRKHNSIKTSLPAWQWIDTDERMLYGMMDLFMQFIKDENPYNACDWNYDERHRKIYDTMKEIENWWKLYPHQLNMIDNALDEWYNESIKNGHSLKSDELSKKLYKLQDKLAKEEHEMLHKLIDIRTSLWT